MVFLGALWLLLLANCFEGRLSSSINDSCDLSQFPSDFKFGSGSSAYQIEGAYNEDGKGRSFFDWYLNTNLSKYITVNGNVAADSYHKYLDDIAAMKEIGLDYYRFSISWTRILPNGMYNEINQAGVDHYNKLIDALLEAGIEPLVTLTHFDTPFPLYMLGHWTSPTIIDFFVKYADLAFQFFGDRVKLWGTVNEPQSVCAFLPEYFDAVDDLHTPLGTYEYLCLHNILLAHAKVYRLYEEKYKSTQNGKIGVVISYNYNIPLTNSTEDLETTDRANAFVCDWILNPLVYGDYPQIMKDVIGNNSIKQNFTKSRLPEFSDEEKELIKGTYDVVMFNYYYTYMVTTSEYNNTPSYNNDLQVTTSIGDDWKVTSQGIPIYNKGIRYVAKYIKERFGNPEIMISENGFSVTGGVNDTDRIGYIQDALNNARLAMCEDEVNLTVYIYWSLLDSFEFSSGYTAKFGLVEVDYNSTNLTRTLKESAYYYHKLIETKLINATT